MSEKHGSGCCDNPTASNTAELNEENVVESESQETEQSEEDGVIVVDDSEAEELDFNHCKIRKLENLERLKKIQFLGFRQNLIKRIEKLDTLVTLTSLELYDNQLTKIENLDSLINLETLDLSFNRLRKIENLDRLPKLKKLFLVHNKIEKIENLEKLVNLEMLELGDNKIRVLENLQSLIKLKELYVGKNKIRKIENLYALEKLEILSMQANRITIIENLENLISLTHLYLASNGLSQISGLESNRNLETLELSHNRIHKLQNLSHLSKLEEFWFNDNLLDQWADVDELKDLPNLHTVYFERNPIYKDATYRRKMMLCLPQALSDGVISGNFVSSAMRLRATMIAGSLLIRFLKIFLSNDYKPIQRIKIFRSYHIKTTQDSLSFEINGRTEFKFTLQSLMYILPLPNHDLRDIMVQCFNADDRRAYIHRLEKVKFGVPIDDAFTHDIPATLLVLLLKINKQGPVKKDIWRAPGNQSHVRKLINIMQHGRLVNIDNFSVYTAASVVKKFLCKIPFGIFGSENEEKLFDILSLNELDKQCSLFCRIVSTLPVVSQHLLVLLIGTFSCIVENAERYQTKMNPEALGVSVAPSIFHTCIHDRSRAKMEDIVRFRDASKVIAFMIQQFGRTNLFPRENYEFYARITGRTLRVDENWQFTFHMPSTCGFNTLNNRSTNVKTFNNPKLSSGGLMNFRRSIGNIQFDERIGTIDDPPEIGNEESAATTAATTVFVNHCRGSFTKSNAGTVRYTADTAAPGSKLKFYDLCFTTSSFPRYHHHFKGGCYILSAGNRPGYEVQRATQLDDGPMSPPPLDASVPVASTLMRRQTLTPPRSRSSPAQALAADSLDDLWNVNKALLPLTLTTGGVVGCAVNAHWSQLCCPYIDDSLQYQPTIAVGSSFVWASIDDAENGCKANSCEF